MGDTGGAVEISDRHRWALDAFMAAMQRYEERRRMRDRDVTRAALAEVLWWAVALIDALKGNAHWEVLLDQPRQRPHTGTERDQVRGVRWARHRVGHQLVDAVVIREGNFLPAALPMVGFGYCWRSVDLLPLADPAHREPDDEAAYFIHLDGRAVAGTIGDLKRLFRDAIVHGP